MTDTPMIQFDPDGQVLTLSTRHTSYQMHIAPGGIVQHLYYGPRIDSYPMDYIWQFTDRGFSGNPYEYAGERDYSLDQLPQEYSCYGVGDYRIGALRAVLANGSRSVDLRYRSHEICPGCVAPEGLPHARSMPDSPCSTLVLHLEDTPSGLLVSLVFQVFYERDVITRHVCLKNASDAAITLEKAASLTLDLPADNWELIHFAGRHCMERQPVRTALQSGIQVIGSSRGMSSHHHNPFVLLTRADANEDYGLCYGCMLAYSGNFRAEVEIDQAGMLRLVMGLSDEGFAWYLAPGEQFTTPQVLLSVSESGLASLSHQFHQMLRMHVLPPLPAWANPRPVLLNSWEAMYFNFTSESLLQLARQAADLGADLFVLDDGWFGERDNDRCALGDWYANEHKLPGGLAPLAEALRDMGLKLGLWVEPEMISPDSALYRAHPDWALADPGRPPMLAREQLVLDLSRDDVRTYISQRLDEILDSAPIVYLKWDFNRGLANVYSNACAPQRQGEIAHRYMLGVYALLQHVRDTHPEVLIEGCAGGGGRFDAGMLFYCPQIWCSDDTDPILRLAIQRGTSYGYPPCTMGAHVSASPNHQSGRSTPLYTRAVVAMAGTFGYELDPAALSDAQRESIREQIASFRAFDTLLRTGDYYRLETGSANVIAWAFVRPDRKEALVSVVAADMQVNEPFVRLRLRGLDPDCLYRIDGDARCYPGLALLKGGYTLPQLLHGDYPALQLHLCAVEA